MQSTQNHSQISIAVENRDQEFISRINKDKYRSSNSSIAEEENDNQMNMPSVLKQRTKRKKTFKSKRCLSMNIPEHPQESKVTSNVNVSILEQLKNNWKMNLKAEAFVDQMRKKKQEREGMMFLIKQKEQRKRRQSLRNEQNHLREKRQMQMLKRRQKARQNLIKLNAIALQRAQRQKLLKKQKEQHKKYIKKLKTTMQHHQKQDQSTNQEIQIQITFQKAKESQSNLPKIKRKNQPTIQNSRYLSSEEERKIQEIRKKIVALSYLLSKQQILKY